MPLDPSIYGQIQQPANPIDQYARALQVKNMMGQGQLQNIQTQEAQNNLDQQNAVRKAFQGLQPGQDISSIIPDVMRASPQQGIALQKSMLENRQNQANIAEKEAPIMAAGVSSILHDDSDAGVEHAFKLTTMLSGQPHEDIKNHILSIPQAQRKQAVIAMMQSSPVGQAALKQLYPEIETKDLMGTTTVKTPLSGVTKPAPGGTPNAKGQMDLIESGAKALADYTGPVPSAFALKSPLIQAQLARAREINPDYDVATHQQVIKAVHDFGTGKQGNSVRSFNVALNHLDTLDQLSDALKNGDMQAVNKIGNYFQSQTGSPAPTNFVAAKKIVSDEIVKAIVGSGGGVTDREEAAKAVDSANSPAQLKGVIQTYKNLMVGQLDGLEQQYEASTKRKDFQDKYLSAQAKKLYQAHLNASNDISGGTPANSAQIQLLLDKYGKK